MIVLLWFLNFAISWSNAWGVGKTWNESKAVGGMPHFMNWMAAIMASVGFSWCYLVIVGVVGQHVPIEQDDGTTAMLLTPEMAQAFFDLGYLAIIGPCIGSGLAITVHSWGVFWRRRQFADGCVAGYNTFAQVHNIYTAAQYVPNAIGNVGRFFDSDDSSDGKGRLVIILVAVCVLGGILTTYAIVKSVAKSTARARGWKYDEMWQDYKATHADEIKAQQEQEAQRNREWNRR